MTQVTTTSDLSFLDDSDSGSVTARVPVVNNEDGEDVSGFIIIGKDSKEFQELNAQLRIEGLQKSAKRKTMIDASTDEGAKTLHRAISSSETRLALCVVTGWFGFSNKGEEVPFNKELLAKMFAKKPTWQAKVLAALEVDSNFTKS